MAAERVHIIGAGVAGLAAAVALAKRGRKVVLSDAAGHGGGRCRSFFEPRLDRRIDNGNHLMLSGNGAIRAYLADIGAADALTGPDEALYPFLDLRTGERWDVRPDAGVIPWSILTGRGRVPGTALGEYLRGLRLAWAGPDATISQCLGGPGRLFERFWEPLAVGVLNTPCDAAAASLLWPVMKETFGRGAAACRPRVARVGLSEAFVDPAVACLEALGAEVRFNRRLRALEFAGGRISALSFTDGAEAVGRGEAVVLAVPAWSAADLLPGYDGPQGTQPIVNAHFRLPKAPPAQQAPLLGLVGGSSQWLFVRGDVASVTVSAADALAAEGAENVAERLWAEVKTALDLEPALPLPAHRIVKERRATIAQTPAEIRRRPGPRTRWENLVLAGDWTATGLPATIEGAIRSGNTAAALV